MRLPDIQTVEAPDDGVYIHVTFRYPYRFTTIRTPDWAQRVGNSVSKNSEVRMGKLKRSGNWKVQSVLITKKYHSKEQAEDLAERILMKIET
jgi:hypothetical protein